MKLGNYDGSLSVQPESAIQMIRICFVVLPAVLAGVMVQYTKWFINDPKLNIANGIINCAEALGTFVALSVFGSIVFAMGLWKGNMIGAALMAAVAIFIFIFTKEAPVEEAIDSNKKFTLGFLKKRNIWGSILYISGLYGAYSIMILWVPTICIEMANYSETTAGLMSTDYTLAGSVAGLLSGVIAAKLKNNRTMLLLSSCGFVICSLIMCFLIRSSLFTYLPIVLVIAGFLLYMGLPLCYTMTSISVDPDDIGGASSTVNAFAVLIGSTIYPIAFAVLIGSTIYPIALGALKDATGSFLGGFIVMTVLAIVFNVGGAFIFDMEKINQSFS